MRRTTLLGPIELVSCVELALLGLDILGRGRRVAEQASHPNALQSLQRQEVLFESISCMFFLTNGVEPPCI